LRLFSASRYVKDRLPGGKEEGSSAQGQTGNPRSSCNLYAGLASKEQAVTNGIPQLTVKELKRRIDAGEQVYILDVRDPFEYQIANLGGKLIPQNEILQRLAEIDPDREIIVQCHVGIRSQYIAELLKQAGYPRVVNLAGGILAWASEIDPKMPRY
jgi:adenylyltransferase/sulfurtransferase